MGVPPSGHGGRSWSVGVVCVWGGGGPASLRASQQWHLRFQADHASCRGTPSLASPLSRHLCCIHTANSVPLPGSVLPTPHFSIQPPPTSVDSHPRQGHLGLIPKEALGWAALRPPEPSQAGGKAQKGAPPSASGCQRSRPVGEGVIMAAAPLARHSTRMPCFCGVPGFFCRHSPLWSSLLLSLQAVFSQPIAVPSLGLHSKPHFPAPSPPSQQVTHNSGWNAQSWDVDPACHSYFVLPSTDLPLRSPLIPWRSFSVPVDFPTVREFFWVWGPPFTFSFLPGCWSLFWYSFFLSFVLLGCEGIFLALLGVQKSSANVQHVLYENCSICRCLLDVLVRSDEFHILLFHHLDCSSRIFFKALSSSVIFLSFIF